MSPRRAIVWLLLALACAGASIPLRPEKPAAQGSSASIAPPPERAAASLFLGGFEVIVADALWVRLLDRFDRGEYAEVVPIAEAILALDPRFEQAWTVAAWTIAVDLPALEPEDARWPWVREGLLLLRKGSSKNPGSWFLRFREGFFVLQFIAPRMKINEPAGEAAASASRPEIDLRYSRRFLRDAVVNPDGVSAFEYAWRRFDEAGQLPRHSVVVDELAIRAALECGRVSDARRAYEHIRAAHDGADPEFMKEAEQDIESAEKR